MTPDQVMRAILDDLHVRSHGVHGAFIDACYLTLMSCQNVPPTSIVVDWLPSFFTVEFLMRSCR